MKFCEVEQALKDGKKVKLISWKNAYWYQNEQGELINHFEEGEELPVAVVEENASAVPETDQTCGCCADEPVHDDGFCFSEALYRLKHGQKVARKGWNGKGMFLFLADGIEFHTDADLSCVRHLEGDLTLPAIVLKTADDQFCVGWLASQTDLLADDWQIV